MDTDQLIQFASEHPVIAIVVGLSAIALLGVGGAIALAGLE